MRAPTFKFKEAKDNSNVLIADMVSIDEHRAASAKILRTVIGNRATGFVNLRVRDSFTDIVRDLRIVCEFESVTATKDATRWCNSMLRNPPVRVSEKVIGQQA